MNRAILSVLCIYLFSCVGCTTRENIFNGRLIEIKEFDCTSKITAKKLLLTDPPMGFSAIRKIDSLVAFIHHRGGSDYFFSLYDVKNDKFLGKFMRRGRGPDEFMLVEYSGDYVIDQNGDIHICCFAANERVVLKCNVSAFLRTGKYTTEVLYTFPSFSLKRTHILSDSCFLSHFYDPQQQQMLYQMTQPHSANDKDVPLYNIEIPLDEYFLFGSIGNLSPNKDKLALAMTSFALINILDPNNPKNNLSIMPDRALYRDVETVRNNIFTDRRVTYESIKCEGQYIFALYSGVNSGEREKASGVELHVVDWKGKGVARLFIDEILMSFCIDESSKTMYALDYFEELYTYDLSKVI